jgi:hypothetical protein
MNRIQESLREKNIKRVYLQGNKMQFNMSEFSGLEYGRNCIIEALLDFGLREMETSDKMKRSDVGM